MKMTEKFDELVEKATDIIDEYSNGTINDTALKLMDMCYNILLISELEKLAPKTVKSKTEADAPAKGKKIPPLPPQLTPLKEVSEEDKKDLNAAFNASKPVAAVIPQPPAPSKIAPKPKTNQKYIDGNWRSYFDDGWITVYERHVPAKNSPMEHVFFSTLTKTGEQMDVAFGGFWESKFNEIKKDSATFIPDSFEIQERNGYAKLYVKSIGSVDQGGKPIEIR